MKSLHRYTIDIEKNDTNPGLKKYTVTVKNNARNDVELYGDKLEPLLKMVAKNISIAEEGQ